MSFCSLRQLLPLPFPHRDTLLEALQTYMLRLHSTLSHSLHHASFLILYIPYPIRLPRCYQHVRIPSIDVPVQLFVLVYLPSSRQLYGAIFTIVLAVIAILRWIDFGEQGGSGRGFDEMLAVVELGNSSGGGCGCEELLGALEG